MIAKIEPANPLLEGLFKDAVSAGIDQGFGIEHGIQPELGEPGGVSDLRQIEFYG